MLDILPRSNGRAHRPALTRANLVAGTLIVSILTLGAMIVAPLLTVWP